MRILLRPLDRVVWLLTGGLTCPQEEKEKEKEKEKESAVAEALPQLAKK
jgi:hypothetical protein